MFDEATLIFNVSLTDEQPTTREDKHGHSGPSDVDREKSKPLVKLKSGQNRIDNIGDGNKVQDSSDIVM